MLPILPDALDTSLSNILAIIPSEPRLSESPHKQVSYVQIAPKGESHKLRGQEAMLKAHQKRDEGHVGVSIFRGPPPPPPPRTKKTNKMAVFLLVSLQNHRKETEAPSQKSRHPSWGPVRWLNWPALCPASSDCTSTKTTLAQSGKAWAVAKMFQATAGFVPCCLQGLGLARAS